MSIREQKAREADRSAERIDQATNGFVIFEYNGTELRKQHRDLGSAYVVVENTLALIRKPGVLERQLLQIRLIAILEYILRQRVEMQEQMQQLIVAMMPSTTVPLPPYVLQARRNAVARDALFREFGAMTSAQVGESAGSKSPNRGALAHRWKSDGRIFSVLHRGSNYFPGFQFTDQGQPVAVIGEVISILGEKFAPWELALWFTQSNGWLGGRRPVDLLLEAPDGVVAAAEREAEERVF